MGKSSLSIIYKGAFVMQHDTVAYKWWRTVGLTVGVSLILSPGLSWGLEIGKTQPEERREAISLADAAVQALKHNLDITISRQTTESLSVHVLERRGRRTEQSLAATNVARLERRPARSTRHLVDGCVPPILVRALSMVGNGGNP